jgi:uncharacterized protein YcfL
MKPALLVLLFSFLLLGCASAPSVSPERDLVLANQEIRVGNGTFIFRDVVLDKSTLPGSWIIKGFVRNNTGRNWKRVAFDFRLYDMTGAVLNKDINSNITFITHSINNGEVQSFSTNYFQASPRTVWKYEVMYKGTKHGFIMVKPQESRDLVFEDQSIKIRFSLSEKQIAIVLQNKMYSPIKVDWNNISYVDIAGSLNLSGFVAA